MNKTLKMLYKMLEEAKKNAWMHEIGNDMYYTSKQKEEDDAIINSYKEKIKELESQAQAE